MTSVLPQSWATQLSSMGDASDNSKDEGLMGKIERLVTPPAEGTPLRPYIRLVRENVESVASDVSGSVQRLEERVGAEVEAQLQALPEMSPGDQNRPKYATALQQAMIRPELKFGAVVGGTALVSLRFGGRAFLRNTFFVGALAGLAFYPQKFGSLVPNAENFEKVKAAIKQQFLGK